MRPYSAPTYSQTGPQTQSSSSPQPAPSFRPASQYIPPKPTSAYQTTCYGQPPQPMRQTYPQAASPVQPHQTPYQQPTASTPAPTNYHHRVDPPPRLPLPSTPQPPPQPTPPQQTFFVPQRPAVGLAPRQPLQPPPQTRTIFVQNPQSHAYQTPNQPPPLPLPSREQWHQPPVEPPPQRWGEKGNSQPILRPSPNATWRPPLPPGPPPEDKHFKQDSNPKVENRELKIQPAPPVPPQRPPIALHERAVETQKEHAVQPSFTPQHPERALAQKETQPTFQPQPTVDRQPPPPTRMQRPELIRSETPQLSVGEAHCRPQTPVTQSFEHSRDVEWGDRDDDHFDEGESGFGGEPPFTDKAYFEDSMREGYESGGGSVEMSDGENEAEEHMNEEEREQQEVGFANFGSANSFKHFSAQRTDWEGLSRKQRKRERRKRRKSALEARRKAAEEEKKKFGKPSCSLNCCGLPAGVSDSMLITKFSEFGEVVKMTRMYAAVIVTYTDPQHARSAILHLDGMKHVFGNKWQPLMVRFCRNHISLRQHDRANSSVDLTTSEPQSLRTAIGCRQVLGSSDSSSFHDSNPTTPLEPTEKSEKSTKKETPDCLTLGIKQDWWIRRTTGFLKSFDFDNRKMAREKLGLDLPDGNGREDERPFTWLEARKSLVETCLKMHKDRVFRTQKYEEDSWLLLGKFFVQSDWFFPTCSDPNFSIQISEMFLEFHRRSKDIFRPRFWQDIQFFAFYGLINLMGAHVQSKAVESCEKALEMMNEWYTEKKEGKYFFDSVDKAVWGLYHRDAECFTHPASYAFTCKNLGLSAEKVVEIQSLLKVPTGFQQWHQRRTVAIFIFMFMLFGHFDRTFFVWATDGAKMNPTDPQFSWLFELRNRAHRQFVEQWSDEFPAVLKEAIDLLVR